MVPTPGFASNELTLGSRRRLGHHLPVAAWDASLSARTPRRVPSFAGPRSAQTTRKRAAHIVQAEAVAAVKRMRHSAPLPLEVFS